MLDAPPAAGKAMYPRAVYTSIIKGSCILVGLRPDMLWPMAARMAAGMPAAAAAAAAAAGAGERVRVHAMARSGVPLFHF